MAEQWFTGGFLFQLATFIAWSGVLSGLALATSKVFPKIINWSRFWQAWLVIALVPLLPALFSQTNAIIPEQLKTAFGDSQQSLVLHSNSVVSQMKSSGELQVFIFLVILMLVLGVCLSLLRFVLGLWKVRQFIQQATLVTDLKAFSPAQRKTITANSIKILVTDQTVSPFVFGFFRVNMLLPKSVFTMPAAQQCLLIDHELMHIKRQDPKAVILFRLCACLFLFNPLSALWKSVFYNAWN